jgi:hypothetical protein
MPEGEFGEGEGAGVVGAEALGIREAKELQELRR